MKLWGLVFPSRKKTSQVRNLLHSHCHCIIWLLKDLSQNNPYRYRDRRYSLGVVIIFRIKLIAISERKKESTSSTFIITGITNGISYLDSLMRLTLWILFVDFVAFTAETIHFCVWKIKTIFFNKYTIHLKTKRTSKSGFKACITFGLSESLIFMSLDRPK